MLLQVLDAPSLQDDFYLNLVDWSSQNVLAVGLGTCVYLWSASNCKVSSLHKSNPILNFVNPFSTNVCVCSIFRSLSYVIWDPMMVCAQSNGPERVPTYRSVQILVKFRYTIEDKDLSLSSCFRSKSHFFFLLFQCNE